MSGIPRYNNAPLNARSGVPVPPTGPSPHPSQPSQPSQTASGSSPLNNLKPTTTSSPHPSYPQAHPAAAVPHPTGLTNSSSQRYAPALITGTDKPPPTRTIKEDSEVPPAPQPAEFPKPTTGFVGNKNALQVKAAVPPPPRAGQASSTMPQNPNVGQREGYPPQMNIPPPSITRAPFSSTVTGTDAQIQRTMHSQPVSIGDAYAQHAQSTRQSANEGGERRSLEHPPGYVQNAYAAELSSDQRRALDANEVEGGRNTSVSGVFSGGMMGGVGGSTSVGGEEGIWESAKRWVGSAGNKLSEGEKEVWRRINGEQ
ncbi:hypothetical protein DSL72_000200 [Monilinia vaccinii-corymbosi]|uniref:Uncharacterized protein n=1 Tax=Monilinia vaccinii-corymbosi TaxID=61207 RepID=A0A8A3P109_9HELO|nr:hypothetical protein DSL72_000200 [Monilinia vaccinii-corymbosi]